MTSLRLRSVAFSCLVSSPVLLVASFAAAQAAGADAAPTSAAPAPTEAAPVPDAAAAPRSPDVAAAPSTVPAPAPAEEPVAPSADKPSIEPAPDVQTPKSHFFELGGRLGYGMPFGNLMVDQPMNKVFKGSVPLQFDGLFRLSQGFGIGLYAGLNVGVQGEALDGCNNCSLWNWRVGLQGTYHFNSQRSFDPWLGLGIGYEATSVSQRYTILGVEYQSDLTYASKPELMAQAGLDLGNEKIAFGPYLVASYGVYSSATGTVKCVDVGCGSANVAERESSIPDGKRASHAWLMVGVRGSYMQ